MKNGMHICNESVFISLARWPKLTFTRAVKGIRQYLSKMAEKSFPSCCSHFPTNFFFFFVPDDRNSNPSNNRIPRHYKIHSKPP